MQETGKQLQSKVLKYLNQQDFVVAYNIISASERGVPDILACINGKFVGLEIKGYGDKLSSIQTAQRKRITKAGGKCYVVRRFEDVKEIMKWN
jgi:Holliday junction resolvase